MKLNSNLSALSGGLLLILMLFMGGLLYNNMSQWRAADLRLKHTQASMSSIEEISSLVLQAESAVRTYAVTGNSGALVSYDRASSALERQEGRLAGLERDHKEQYQNLRALTDLVKKRQARFNETILFRRTRGFDAARLQKAIEAGNSTSTELLAAAEKMQKAERRDMRAWELQSTAGSIQQRRLLTSSFLVIFLIVLGAFAAVLHGIRHRIRTEDELGDANARLQSVLEAASQVSIIATDLVGTITLFNSGAEKMLGYRAEELVGLQTPAKIHLLREIEQRGRELTEKLGRPVQGFDVFVEMARQGGFENREWTYVRKDGTAFPVELIVTGVKGHNGKLTGFLGLATDISARKRAELEMRKLSTAVKSSPTSIIITDREGLIEYANPKFMELTGYSAKELLGQNPKLINSGKIPKSTIKELWDTILDGREWNGELLNRKKSGELFWEHAAISPVKDPRGNITNFIAVKVDITDRKVAQREIEKARDAAMELARMKSEFLANMSHEIRTPMNAIIGMTGLLLDTQLNEQQRDYVKTVNGAGEALLGIINDILDFSKIESGKLTIEKLDFDLLETVESTTELLAPRAQEKGVELAHFVEKDVPAGLRGDQGRLRQVLLNLLGNALKFTEAGEVVLKVSIQKETASGPMLRFSVKDTGIGIPAEAQKNLFQVFTQADASTTRKYGGTGLGLSISKKLVEIMGGEIGLESEPGKGSTFWFTLPFERQSGEQPPAPEKTHLTGIKALIVDDNAANREIVSRYLEAWEMRFEAVASGKEALQALKREAAGKDPFRLVLLDMHMTGMDGLMLARAIQEDAGIPLVRKVMMTSLGQSLKAEELKAAGISICLTKPVRPASLLKALDSALAEPARGGDKAPPPVPARIAERALNKYFRVLVAEDNIVNQKVAMKQLEKLGYESDVAANGLEVLEAMKRRPYELVLMDCQMPEMDGFQATAEIRKLEEDQRHTPIVAMTANALQGDREKCLASGMDGYLSKPVRLEKLAEVMEKWDTPLDAAAVKELMALAGKENPAFMDELVTAYMKDVPSRIEAIRAGIRAGDAEALRLAAHALKGSSGNAGAQRIQRICRLLELIGISGSVEGAGEHLEALEKEMAGTSAAMEGLRMGPARPQ
ncbi:MAG: response regulator [Elusimicrobiales bacterium]|nr:response regulator [Elusimicrobiales bacterium]